MQAKGFAKQPAGAADIRLAGIAVRFVSQENKPASPVQHRGKAELARLVRMNVKTGQPVRYGVHFLSIFHRNHEDAFPDQTHNPFVQRHAYQAFQIRRQFPVAINRKRSFITHTMPSMWSVCRWERKA